MAEDTTRSRPRLYLPGQGTGEGSAGCRAARGWVLLFPARCRAPTRKWDLASGTFSFLTPSAADPWSRQGGHRLNLFPLCGHCSQTQCPMAHPTRGVPRSPVWPQRVPGGARTPAGTGAVLPRARAGVCSSPGDSRRSRAHGPGRLNQRPGGRRGPFPPPAPGKTS